MTLTATADTIALAGVGSASDDVAFLTSLVLFNDVPEHDVRFLSRLIGHERYAPGDMIFEQDELGSDLIIIREGTVSVFLTKDGEKIELAQLGSGSYFGEMSIFDTYPRSANVKALTPVRTYRIGKAPFYSFIRLHPAALLQMCKIFSHRLRNTNSVLTRH